MKWIGITIGVLAGVAIVLVGVVYVIASSPTRAMRKTVLTSELIPAGIETTVAFVNIGLSSYDALRTSTYNPAKYLGGLDEFGTIEVGKRADLVLLEANPLENIINTRLIDGVMVRGRWYTRTDLDKMLEEIAKANR